MKLESEVSKPDGLWARPLVRALWKTRLTCSFKNSFDDQAVENFTRERTIPDARLPRSVLQRIRLGNGGYDLRRRALRRYLAGMLPQFRERHPANSIRNQNSESQRRQRRTYQHQHIHCILHIPNTLLGFPEGPSRFGLDAQTRRPDTLSSHPIPNRTRIR
jgi:hypothetical protein